MAKLAMPKLCCLRVLVLRWRMQSLHWTSALATYIARSSTCALLGCPRQTPLAMGFVLPITAVTTKTRMIHSRPRGLRGRRARWRRKDVARRASTLTMVSRSMMLAWMRAMGAAEAKARGKRRRIALDAGALWSRSRRPWRVWRLGLCGERAAPQRRPRRERPRRRRSVPLGLLRDTATLSATRRLPVARTTVPTAWPIHQRV
mmetsp:Transcript_8335/g.18275  ORF Transcript_8335/g.18275 Transcript_8335/m.18275 type:complete len:203 (-) Transcript_8335:259-867(-)